MPEYLSPGVYIEEQETGPEPIEGVSTSVTGFVGVAQRGPVDASPPVLVTSFAEYQRIFGGYFTPAFSGSATTGDTYNLLPHAVAGFYNNGGQLLYIKRVASSATVPAIASISNLENNVATPVFVTRLTSTAATGRSPVAAGQYPRPAKRYATYPDSGQERCHDNVRSSDRSQLQRPK